MQKEEILNLVEQSELKAKTFAAKMNLEMEKADALRAAAEYWDDLRMPFKTGDVYTTLNLGEDHYYVGVVLDCSREKDKDGNPMITVYMEEYEFFVEEGERYVKRHRTDHCVRRDCNGRDYINCWLTDDTIRQTFADEKIDRMPYDVDGTLNIHIGCLDAIEETLVAIFPEAFCDVKFKVPKDEIDARREEEELNWNCRMQSIELGEGWFEKTE